MPSPWQVESEATRRLRSQPKIYIGISTLLRTSSSTNETPVVHLCNMTTYAIITLTHARTELDTPVIESHISAALAINPNKVTVMCDEEVATIIVYPDEKKNDDDDASKESLMMMDAGFISTKLNELIQSGQASAWANLDSICEPANDGKEILFALVLLFDPSSVRHLWSSLTCVSLLTLQFNIIFFFVQRKRFHWKKRKHMRYGKIYQTRNVHHILMLSPILMV